MKTLKERKELLSQVDKGRYLLGNEFADFYGMVLFPELVDHVLEEDLTLFAQTAEKIREKFEEQLAHTDFLHERAVIAANEYPKTLSRIVKELRKE